MITKKIFTDLAIFMIAFGIIIGICFPFFVLITGTPSTYVITPLFFIFCIVAGVLVGVFNVIISKKIVGSQIKKLSFHMKKVQTRLLDRSVQGASNRCVDDSCYITIRSEDEFGESAEAFNTLVKTLSKAFYAEDNVRSFSGLLASNLELEKLAEDALSQLMTYINANAGAILLENDGELRLISSFAIEMPEQLLKKQHIWKVISDRKRLVLEFPEGIKLDGLLITYQPKSLLIEPILHKDICLGVIVLGSMEAFDSDKLNMMELFGQGLSLAFKNAISHSQLQHLAAIDPLTSILNRRFGGERLQDEFARSIKYNIPLGVLMFDIDHFKVVNDTYGHIVGDKVLLNLSKAVRLILRKGDIFYRYGGEEFVVILPGASKKDVIKAAEMIRHAAEDLETNYNNQVLKITVSVGGTSYPEKEVNNSNDFIKIADTKMYQAKDSGRNCSVVE